MEKKAVNKRAYHDYEILETFEAGIALLGTEIKSIRNATPSIQEAWIRIEKGEAFLVQATIPIYAFGNINNHDEKRERRLLLHKKEIMRLKKAIEQKGLTIVPLSLYLKGGLVKLSIGLGKGKKMYDKRASLKEKQLDREMDRLRSHKR